MLGRHLKKLVLDRATFSLVSVDRTKDAGDDASEYGLVRPFQFGQILVEHSPQDDEFLQRLLPVDEVSLGHTEQLLKPGGPLSCLLTPLLVEGRAA